MKTVGIVTEYNPFHLGHLHQINETRAAFENDAAIVCVMSGNFVQRGDAAIFNKHARACAAVESGADLVLELPAPWALGSAERFAEGAVSILDSLGLVSHISFGSESGDTALLEELALALISPALGEEMKPFLAEGLPFAEARQRALEEKLGEKAAELRKPNNLLAAEYIKALYNRRSAIKPHAIKRVGAGHDEHGGGEIMSASEIRLKWASSEDMRNAVPKAAFDIYENEMRQGRGPVRLENLECAILSRLRMMPQEYFETLPDASEGLGNRLFAAVRSQASLDGVIAEAKTKRYAMSRIRRLVMCAALGIGGDVSAEEPPYIRVLAANEKGRAVLKEAAERASKPIITKPAAVKKLDSFAQKVFEIENGAANLYCLAYGELEERRPSGEWRATPYMK